MRTIEEVLPLFRNHTPDPDLDQDRIKRHEDVDVLFTEMVVRLWHLMPDGPGKTVAIRSLQESRMWCNAAIANQGK
jgi:hypothetical protein